MNGHSRVKIENNRSFSKGKEKIRPLSRSEVQDKGNKEIAESAYNDNDSVRKGAVERYKSK